MCVLTHRVCRTVGTHRPRVSIYMYNKAIPLHTAEMPFFSYLKLFGSIMWLSVWICVESVFSNAGPAEIEIHGSFPITSEQVDFKSTCDCL